MGKPLQSWFTLAMVNGVEITASLSLIGRPDTPASIKMVADVFAEVAWPGRIWERDRDIPRIGIAFRSLAQGVRVNPSDSNRFPTPQDFLIAIPVAKVKRIEEAPRGRIIPTNSEEGKARIAEIKSKMFMTRESKSEKLPDLSDKFACVNWSRRKRGLPEFADEEAWHEFSARARARQESVLARMEHEEANDTR